METKEPTLEFDELTGTKRWKLNGKLHRVGAPAVMYHNGDESYYQHGKRHREDGPAMVSPFGDREWWIEGDQLTEAEFNARGKETEVAGYIAVDELGTVNRTFATTEDASRARAQAAGISDPTIVKGRRVTVSPAGVTPAMIDAAVLSLTGSGVAVTRGAVEAALNAAWGAKP